MASRYIKKRESPKRVAVLVMKIDTIADDWLYVTTEGESPDCDGTYDTWVRKPFPYEPGSLVVLQRLHEIGGGVYLWEAAENV
jgi:hypothetical protein